MDTPKYYEFMNPVLQALREGGGTLTNEEIVDAVARIMHLPNQVTERRQAGHANTGEVEYRTAWAKSYLKHAGYLTQSARGIWALTPEGKDADTVDVRAIVTAVRQVYRARRKVPQAVQQTEGHLDLTTEEVPQGNALAEVEEELSWKDHVLEAVLAMPPDAFERLSQRLLRECGFTQVAVTGRSGDGGIDGKGVLRLGGLINFQVVFQCKRYTGTVSASVVRDFRGAMIGRADKGLIITTGTFSRDARAEAIRDGAPAIDLVDGQELAALLKQYELGVKTVDGREGFGGWGVVWGNLSMGNQRVQSNRGNYLPDVKDGLTHRERIVLQCLYDLQQERGGRNVPTGMLYGTVVEHVDMSVEEMQSILVRLIGDKLRP